MKNLLKTLAVSAIGLGLLAGAVGSSEAGVPAPRTASVTSDAQGGSLIDVQYRRHHGGGHWRHGGRHYPRHRYYRGGSGFYLGFGTPYYNPYYRPYYTPPVYARPRYVAPAYGRMSGAHVRWCYNRYRSYRASDNSFQPYNGPRRQCYSPYS